MYANHPDRKIYRFLLPVVGYLLLLNFGISNPASAQKKVNIQSADEVIGITVEGDKVRKLIGDVHLRSKKLDMYCDSAYQYLNRSLIRAFGNIEINTQDENIWADTLNYYTEKDLSQFRGRVIVENDSTTLFGHRVDYQFNDKIAHFLDQLRLEDQKGTLTAQSGYYFQKQDSAIFRGKVQLADSLQYLEGDSLFMNRKEEHYKMYSGVYARDGKNNLILTGDYMEADSTGRRVLEKNAYLQKFKSDTTDTTHMWAQRIVFTKKDTLSHIEAYHNVKIWSPKFSAVSDTAIYDEGEDLFTLRSKPMAWHKNIQLTGPVIKVYLNDNEVDHLVSYPSPISVEKDTTSGRFNQIKGDTITTNFSKGAIDKIYVRQNSHMLYNSKNEQGEADGAVEVQAVSTRIFFKDGSINEVKSLHSINGSYFPESESLKDKKLEGFKWNPEVRPQKPKNGITPRWPPISEERPFKLPKRYISTHPQRDIRPKEKIEK